VSELLDLDHDNPRQVSGSACERTRTECPLLSGTATPERVELRWQRAAPVPAEILHARCG
jgi:hypothetical protein